MLTILQGDWIEQLKTLPDQSVHCCVTSPPYWGLRDYGTAAWEGGDASCDHKNPKIGKATWGPGSTSSSTLHGKPTNDSHNKEGFKGSICPRCGANRVDHQLGLEKTPEEYIAKVVEGFREVWRVLRDDGTLWLNLGDSYAGGGNYRGVNADTLSDKQGSNRGSHGLSQRCGIVDIPDSLKAKDLVGIPWRVAFALQADGWYLRSDIIWAKPNPMPESVTDRPTKSHEYIFLLCKQPKYYYDAEAISEPVMESSLVRAESGVAFGGNKLCPDTRLQSGNLWLPKAEGTNSRMNRSRDPAHAHEYEGKNRSEDDQASGRRLLKNVAEARANGGDHDSPFGVTRNKRTVWTVATSPYKEAHFATFPPDLIRPCIKAGCPRGGTVIDPFAGSGTTGMVAIDEGRKAILIELSEAYVKFIKERTAVTIGLGL